jgi:hypothetical protein
MLYMFPLGESGDFTVELCNIGAYLAKVAPPEAALGPSWNVG